ncbi:ABC transporter permease [Pseudolysinimonas sp.]|uniref:ABC transporter permease n=1 Tax=Pseudolysinimonas sp. TaxID=2680009 RepID=UPI003F81063E
MNSLQGIGTIASIELRQRVRGVAWYVLLGVFAFLVLVVSVVVTWALSLNGARGSGAGLFSGVVYFVLLLATLVAPALGGNAINGDRDAGTLATTQVTLVTTPQLVLGKFLAAWASSLAFLVVAVPFLLWACVLGGVSPVTIVVSLLVLAVEMGVVSALGVGLSGLLRRPLFSIVVTYLLIALLSVGTLIAFGIAGTVMTTPATYRSTQWTADGQCLTDGTFTTQEPRFDRVWWVLAANPYVILADAVPTDLHRGQSPTDLFGTIKLGERTAQLPPGTLRSDCGESSWTPARIIDATAPGWAVGLLIHVVLGAGALVGAGYAIRAPAGRLGAGSRIA